MRIEEILVGRSVQSMGGTLTFRLAFDLFDQEGDNARRPRKRASATFGIRSILGALPNNQILLWNTQETGLFKHIKVYFV